MKHCTFALPSSATLLFLAISALAPQAHADTVVYQDTTTNVSVFVFNGAAANGPEDAAAVDINQLTLAPGSGGMAITSLSFQEYSYNAAAVSERGTMYIWADNGAGGLPGTLLATLDLPLTSIGAYSTLTVTATLAGDSLLIPSDGIIWAGFGYDNDNGASAITLTQLNNLGGYTFDPATVGTDGTQAYYALAGQATANPSLITFGTPNGSDYGWQVTATAATPEPSSITLLGSALVGLAGIARRRFLA